MFLIDMQNKKAVSVEKKSFSELRLSERYDLQEWIANYPDILGQNLLIIQKEFDGFQDTSERLDLLALDKNGKLVIIENKLDDSGKDVVWQALKYVSYCATLKEREIVDIYKQYLGDGDLALKKLTEFYAEQDYENIKLNPADGGQRIILVAANFRKEVTSTVLWLRDHDIDITCIKVTPYQDEGKLYLYAEQILPIQDIGDFQIRLTAKKQEEAILSKEEATRHNSINRFWEKALPVLRTKASIYNNISPSRDNWLSGTSGHSGIAFCPFIKTDCARAELRIMTSDKDKNKSIYHELIDKKNEIESAFGGELDWHELPDNKVSKVCVHFTRYGLKDEEHWDEIISFLAENIAKLITVFNEPLAYAVKGPNT